MLSASIWNVYFTSKNLFNKPKNLRRQDFDLTVLYSLYPFTTEKPLTCGIPLATQSENNIRGNISIYLCFRRLNTVFDTCVSLAFFSKTLNPLVAKNGSKQVDKWTKNSICWSFSWLICHCHGKVNKYKQAFRMGFAYMQKIW